MSAANDGFSHSGIHLSNLSQTSMDESVACVLKNGCDRTDHVEGYVIILPDRFGNIQSDWVGLD
jgi:hypothetical protein